MGVPSFYKWLVSKYPNVAVNAVEDQGDVDSSRPNPNGIEYDNLYLDMNGIIHPCFHPEDQLFPPTTFEEVFNAIFEYIDRLFRIVRPRELLFMSIDGVAPRAKMNQQRSRRYKAAKDAEIAEEEEQRLRTEFECMGKKVLPKEKTELSDSNIITPGTMFMDELSKALQGYIQSRLANDPGWKRIKVILSDANVPGEGEHKIMTYIRMQKNQPGYNQNTKHCLYGLDADLIFLSLATHEVHFSILREDVQQQDHLNAFELSLTKKEAEIVKSRIWFHELEKRGKSVPKKPYQFLNIWILREYLEVEISKDVAPRSIDLERFIDDFVFFCFFTGNDFLPNVPSLEIHEGAVDLLLAVYKDMFKKFGSYLVDTCKLTAEAKAGFIDLDFVEKFLHEVGKYEWMIFQKRTKIRESKIRNMSREITEDEADGDEICAQVNSSMGIETEISERCTVSACSSTEAEKCDNDEVVNNSKELRQKLKDVLRARADLWKNGAHLNDKIKLGSLGYKSRYYKENFLIENEKDGVKHVVSKYLEGLYWVLQYYYYDVPSWSWYFPFYYGPFVSDFKGLKNFSTSFTIGRPFKPLNQLMAVLPPRSSLALPKAYMDLMVKDDSPIISFYPEDMHLDTNGKRFLWQGICKLPFIDELMLCQATGPLERELSNMEADRNSFHKDRIFARASTPTGSKIWEVVKNTDQSKTDQYPIDCASCGISGLLLQCVNLDLDHRNTSLSAGEALVNSEDVLSALFVNTDFNKRVPKLLANVQKPERTVTEADIIMRKLWHENNSEQQHNYRYKKYASKVHNSNRNVRDHQATDSEIWRCAATGWAGRGRSTGNHHRTDNIAAGSRYQSHSRDIGGGTACGRGFSDPRIPGVSGVGHPVDANTLRNNWKTQNFGRGTRPFVSIQQTGASHCNPGNAGRTNGIRHLTDNSGNQMPSQAAADNVGRGGRGTGVSHPRFPGPSGVGHSTDANTLENDWRLQNFRGGLRSTVDIHQNDAAYRNLENAGFRHPADTGRGRGFSNWSNQIPSRPTVGFTGRGRGFSKTNVPSPAGVNESSVSLGPPGATHSNDANTRENNLRLQNFGKATWASICMQNGPGFYHLGNAGRTNGIHHSTENLHSQIPSQATSGDTGQGRGRGRGFSEPRISGSVWHGKTDTSFATEQRRQGL